MFSILSSNIMEKQRMLQRAAFRIKSDYALQYKVAEASAEDVAEYIATI